ncbi:hypothetical protein B0H17DRAFT_1190667 [Mycena rosella]|uniref:Uncharacterized protein n=1 Tax=Mycena rosella TaxID=1033263 RepID=A0AAD7MBX6_MYCRO|nr:hypothetical protein B0H17DRAFT_1190667 [Mycena rosella]
MTMQSFELAADEILQLIDAERADACTTLREHMRKAEAQCTAFRKTAYATHAANVAINAQCNQDIVQLTKALQDLQRTLQQAGIYHSQGHLTFGPQWGAIVRGFRPGSEHEPPLLMTPEDVVRALETQRQENEWWRRRDSSQIFRHELAATRNGGMYGVQCAENNASVYMPLLPSPDFGLKRKVGMASDGSEFATKRSRSTEHSPDMQGVATWGTNPGLNLPRPTFSPRTEDMPRIMPAFNQFNLPCPTSSARTCTSAVATQVPRPASNSPPSVCNDRLLTAPPALEHWRCALVVPSIETRSPPACILPPLGALVGAHACSYYMWFAIRSFLFHRMSDPEPQPLTVRAAHSTEEWEIKLHNKKDGTVEYVYNDASFSNDGAACACGMPPLDSKILRKLTLRADGSPIQSADFASRALQELLCADLELSHAKLQFEQTDDAVLEALAWPAERRAQRAEARANIFRNSWDRSFAPAPLELPDILARRAWILRFRDVLQDWPDFAASMGMSPPVEEDTDALVTYEQRLIAFYLQTVSNTLGVHPARPVQRPDVDSLPELYRNIISPD